MAEPSQRPRRHEPQARSTQTTRRGARAARRTARSCEPRRPDGARASSTPVRSFASSPSSGGLTVDRGSRTRARVAIVSCRDHGLAASYRACCGATRVLRDSKASHASSSIARGAPAPSARGIAACRTRRPTYRRRTEQSPGRCFRGRRRNMHRQVLSYHLRSPTCELARRSGQTPAARAGMTSPEQDGSPTRIVSRRGRTVTRTHRTQLVGRRVPRAWLNKSSRCAASPRRRTDASALATTAVRIDDDEQGRAVRRRDLETPSRHRTAAARQHVSAAAA